MKPLRACAALLLVPVALFTAGCADPADDPRALPAPPPSATGGPAEPLGLCPGPEAPPQPSASPCIDSDPAKRYRENHAFREEMPITDAQRAEARPRAEALAAALEGLAGGKVTRERLQEAVAGAVGQGLQPRDVEVRGSGFGQEPLRNVRVGAGKGKVCVNGRIDETGAASAEVVGRTNDGTCIPGEGGH